MREKLRFSSEPAQLAKVRQFARDFFSGCGYEECAGELLVLALDEACTNIIRHAYGAESKPIQLELERLRDRIRVTLRDYGQPCDPSCIQGRSLEEIRPGGVGVHIIREAFDTVRYEPCRRGTRLILEKKCPSPAGRSKG